MNKKKLILATLFVAVISAVVTSYAILSVQQKNETTKVVHTQDKINTTFTSSITDDRAKGFPDLTYAAERTVPAVVYIENKQIVDNRQNQHYGSSPIFEFFGLPQGGGQAVPKQQQERRSSGSGVIISKDGYIISNNHVVEDASELTVTLNDGKTYKATVIGTDPTTDIALIKIDAQDLPAIPFGNSDDLRLGQWVLAVGNPFNLNSTVTAGIVSAKGRNLDVIPSEFRIESFIQTDAAVNMGNSGGALVNTNGELVGINTVIKSPTGSYAGYSFAVPSSIVNKVVMDLMEYGIVQRAILGIGYNEVNEAFIEQFGQEKGITEKGGLYIGTVAPDGSAAEAGIKVGDILTEFDGVKTNNSSQLQELIAKRRPNEKVGLTIKRGDSVKHFDVLLRNKAGEAKLLDKNSVDMESFLGGQFADISDKTKKQLGIDFGVQVMKIGKGLLSKGGVKEGYIITHINGIAIKSTRDLSKITTEVDTIDGVYPNGRFMSYSVISK